MLKIVYRVCCGMDVHKSFVVACIAATNEQGVTTYKSKRFSTFTGDLRRCAAWLAENNCKDAFIDPKLEAKIVAQAEGNKKSVIKTWSRASMISPDFVGQTVAVHNGNKFIPVYVTENMVGHKLGEFAPTRNFRGHAGNKKK